MNSEEAKKAANKRIIIENIIAATAVVTVAAATAYVIKKNREENLLANVEQLIKAGDTMQRIESQQATNWFGRPSRDKNKNLHDSFYVTNNDFDNKNFEQIFGGIQVSKGREAYKLSIQAAQDIKIASQNTAKNTFRDLITKNENFRKSIFSVDVADNIRSGLKGDYKVSDFYLKRIIEGKSVPESVMKRLYENFNSSLVGAPMNDAEENTRKIFYEALLNKGYGGVQDINDLKRSGLRAKNPLIIFDKSKVNVTDVENITEKFNFDDSTLGQIRKMQYDFAQQNINRLVYDQAKGSRLAIGAAFVSAATGSTLIGDTVKYNKAKTNRNIINDYKQQHPGTSLTDKEILKIHKRKT